MIVQRRAVVFHTERLHRHLGGDLGFLAAIEAGDHVAGRADLVLGDELVLEADETVFPAGETGLQLELLRVAQHADVVEGFILDDRDPAALAVGFQGAGAAHEVHRAEIGEGGIARIGHVAHRVLVAEPDGGADDVQVEETGFHLREEGGQEDAQESEKQVHDRASRFLRLFYCPTLCGASSRLSSVMPQTDGEGKPGRPYSAGWARASDSASSLRATSPGEPVRRASRL